ncbi:hypothetical protein B0H14DRAFT_2622308 [Mycena olivaceomarginata]|nr:hypothetical protein B0H14DRAFT_2622308 [Mycena olivaceomarginata]
MAFIARGIQVTRAHTGSAQKYPPDSRFPHIKADLRYFFLTILTKFQKSAWWQADICSVKRHFTTLSHRSRKPKPAPVIHTSFMYSLCGINKTGPAHIAQPRSRDWLLSHKSMGGSTGGSSGGFEYQYNSWIITPRFQRRLYTSIIGWATTRSPSPPTAPQPSPATANPTASLHQAPILQDLSEIIVGLQRCEGLQDVITQIESGAVQKIRDRYGPVEVGHRNTAQPNWKQYAGLVSKRERLGRILTEDFSGDKDRFSVFFTTPPPRPNRRARTEEQPPTEHFRSFRKTIEARPWCESDISAERRQAGYCGTTGEFSQVLWEERWGDQNMWEIWRQLGGE